MRALNVYTHYSLKNPKHLESFGTSGSGKLPKKWPEKQPQSLTRGELRNDSRNDPGNGQEPDRAFDTGHLIKNVARSETPADCATRRELAAAAQLHRPPRQATRHHARAVDRVVSLAAAGGADSGRSRRRARTATDLAGAAARPPGRTSIARAPARSHGPPGQPAVLDPARPPARRRSRRVARRDRNRRAARHSRRPAADQP